MLFCRSTRPSSDPRAAVFIPGSICPSTLFERYHRFTSPSRRAADLQNFWHPSNTDAPVYMYRRAIFPALRWRSSEREKKLSSRLAASSFFQNFWPVELRSPTDCQIYRLMCDQRHVHASHGVPGLTMEQCQWAMVDMASKHVSHGVHASMPANTKLTWRKNRFASASERAAADSQNFSRLENENAFPQIFSTLVSPCIAVSILVY